MPTIDDLARALATRTRREDAADWDPVGIQLGDPKAEVIRIGVCHEVTEEVVERVEADSVDLLVTYHPLIFHPTRRLLAGRSADSRAYRLIRAGVGLLVAHTDFDAAPGGAADALAAFFDLKDVGGFGGDELAGTPDVGRYGRLGASLDFVDARLSDAYGHAGLRVTGDRDMHVESLAVVPGSGADFIEAAAEVSQALVTGDVPHHRAVVATDLGLAIVDPGHTVTERPGMEALVSLVGEVATVEVVDLTGIDPRTWS